MKTVFLDTDVVIDYLTQRKPFNKAANGILAMGVRKQVALYACSLTFPNVYYMLRKEMSHNRILELFRDFSTFITISQVNSETINQSIDSGFTDFEDAIQNASAEQLEKVDLFVTRNIKDYKNSNLKVVKPEEALAILSI